MIWKLELNQICNLLKESSLPTEIWLNSSKPFAFDHPLISILIFSTKNILRKLSKSHCLFWVFRKSRLLSDDKSGFMMSLKARVRGGLALCINPEEIVRWLSIGLNKVRKTAQLQWNICAIIQKLSIVWCRAIQLCT